MLEGNGRDQKRSFDAAFYPFICGQVKANQNQQENKLEKAEKMANVGIEPKTFALLARRSNQLS
jgi:hypothetical protein